MPIMECRLLRPYGWVRARWQNAQVKLNAAGWDVEALDYEYRIVVMPERDGQSLVNLLAELEIVSYALMLLPERARSIEDSLDDKAILFKPFALVTTDKGTLFATRRDPDPDNPDCIEGLPIVGYRLQMQELKL